MNTTRTAIGAVSLCVLLTLSACGSDDPDSSSATATDSTSVPTGRPGGFDPDQLQEIQQCLEAAGLEDELPTDLPTDLPTGLPSGGPGGGFGALQDPEVQEALEACGIDVAQPPDNDPS